ncbi:MAG: LytTR family DNA-binding domain-containing protein [Eubacteriales bacterium]|nr:LytTR family DNA-binding domain-containing protein [Eubacteriales bacterium]
MKIRIEIEESLEEEIVIRCKELTPRILRYQQMLNDEINKLSQLVLYREDTEYYIAPDDILFFETDDAEVYAHTAKDVYETRRKLYQLEEILPSSFMRISKSAIVNTDKIYSIKRNLSASSAIEFAGTHKQIYVSRIYYKVLKEKLEEKRYEK